MANDQPLAGAGLQIHPAPCKLLKIIMLLNAEDEILNFIASCY